MTSRMFWGAGYKLVLAIFHQMMPLQDPKKPKSSWSTGQDHIGATEHPFAGRLVLRAGIMPWDWNIIKNVAAKPHSPLLCERADDELGRINLATTL
jgi:hypothetical protein